MGPRAWLLPEESWVTLYYTRGVERQRAENVQAALLSAHSSPTRGSPPPPAGAVASSVVKQKLAEVILKKQQAALERTVHPSSPSIPYR